MRAWFLPRRGFCANTHPPYTSTHPQPAPRWRRRPRAGCVLCAARPTSTGPRRTLAAACDLRQDPAPENLPHTRAGEREAHCRHRAARAPVHDPRDDPDALAAPVRGDLVRAPAAPAFEPPRGRGTTPAGRVATTKTRHRARSRAERRSLPPSPPSRLNAEGSMRRRWIAERSRASTSLK